MAVAIPIHGVRLTHISSVLESIPTYFMFLFLILSKVLKKLDKIRRDFLREGNSSSYKYHLIKWEKVLQPKSNKGLVGKRSCNSQQKFANEVVMEVWHR